VGLRYNNGNGPAECDVKAYYDDAGAGASHPCTGDGLAYGSSGFTLRTKQCTDYRYDNNNQYPLCRESPFFFNIKRAHYLMPPGMTVDSAEQYDQYVKNPLESIVMDGVGVTLGICPPSKDFMNETILIDSVYVIEDSIVTENMVEIASGVEVTFDAGQLVRLKPGFLANNGSTFTARIGGCTPSNGQQVEQRSEIKVNLLEWNIYPNPLRDFAVIDYKLSKTTPISIHLFDINGKLLQVLIDHTEKEKGQYQQNIDLNHLQAGLYFVVFQSNSGIESRKISIIK
ncbi:MAG: T9SS type A sorting domain-containing protein, partial [Bacteroidota bacterium]